MWHRIAPMPHWFGIVFRIRFRRFPCSYFRASALHRGCNTIPRKPGYPRPIRLRSHSRHDRARFLPVGRMRSGSSRRRQPHPGFRRPSSRSRRQFQPANVLPRHDERIASHGYTPQVPLAGVLLESVRLGLVTREKAQLEQALGVP